MTEKHLLMNAIVNTQGQTTPRRRILCVEDNADTCEVLAFIFRSYELTFAHSIAAAREHFGDTDYDLYILDNWLPDGSGIELCREIRALFPLTPILFTSAVGIQHSIDEALNAGADRYLLKPVEPDNLVSTVKELLSEEGLAA